MRIRCSTSLLLVAALVVKSVEEIKQILPKREEYLVTTSEFNDVKARLQTVVASLKKEEQAGPTLKRRPPNDDSTGTQNSGNNKTGDDDTPPVLKRQDQNPVTP